MKKIIFLFLALCFISSTGNVCMAQKGTYRIVCYTDTKSKIDYYTTGFIRFNWTSNVEKQGGKGSVEIEYPEGAAKKNFPFHVDLKQEGPGFFVHRISITDSNKRGSVYMYVPYGEKYKGMTFLGDLLLPAEGKSFKFHLTKISKSKKPDNPKLSWLKLDKASPKTNDHDRRPENISQTTDRSTKYQLPPPDEIRKMQLGEKAEVLGKYVASERNLLVYSHVPFDGGGTQSWPYKYNGTFKKGDKLNIVILTDNCNSIKIKTGVKGEKNKLYGEDEAEKFHAFGFNGSRYMMKVLNDDGKLSLQYYQDCNKDGLYMRLFIFKEGPTPESRYVRFFNEPSGTSNRGNTGNDKGNDFLKPELLGKLEGVGIEYETKTYLKKYFVKKITKGWAADYGSYVHVGDEILEINGKKLAGMEYWDVHQLLGGKAGTFAKVKIKHAPSGHVQTYKMIRGEGGKSEREIKLYKKKDASLFSGIYEGDDLLDLIGRDKDDPAIASWLNDPAVGFEHFKVMGKCNDEKWCWFRAVNSGVSLGFYKRKLARMNLSKNGIDNYTAQTPFNVPMGKSTEAMRTLPGWKYEHLTDQSWTKKNDKGVIVVVRVPGYSKVIENISIFAPGQ